MDEPGGLCARGNRPVPEEYILRDSTYICSLKQSNTQRQRGEWWLSEAGGRGRRCSRSVVSVDARWILSIEVLYNVVSVIYSTVWCTVMYVKRIDFMLFSHHKNKTKQTKSPHK